MQYYFNELSTPVAVSINFEKGRINTNSLKFLCSRSNY